MNDLIFKMCQLLSDGREAFARGNPTKAEATFSELLAIAPDDAARNCARLHLAVVYGAGHYIAGLRGPEAADVLKFLDRAENEYEEVLAHNPTDQQRAIAEHGTTPSAKLDLAISSVDFSELRAR